MRADSSTHEELERKRQALINADSNSVSSQIPSCDNNESGGPARLVHYAGPGGTSDEVTDLNDNGKKYA